MLAEMHSLTVAGHETTSNTLTWMLYELARHPEYQDRMHAEIVAKRAEVAAHVHDSVLHTLTLIQRNAENAGEVRRLARAQERDLRAWLYKPEGTGKDADEEPGTPMRPMNAGT